MRAIRNKLTYANVMATILGFVVLGGGAAYAATQLPKNSVGTKQLQNGAVTAEKVKSGSLMASNFAPGQLPAGPQGPKGETGKEGREGAAGKRGLPGEQGKQGVVGEKGERGEKGEAGANGEKGEKGEKGETGSPWPAGGTLPSGRTETGTWNLGPIEGKVNASDSISFAIPLSFRLETSQVHFVGVGDTNPPECPGSVSEPEASSGNLCIYSQEDQNQQLSVLTSYSSGVVIIGEHSGYASAYGTWAVTAPKPQSS
jgi:Collagen triple helix repeat (20 copies)